MLCAGVILILCNSTLSRYCRATAEKFWLPQCIGCSRTGPAKPLWVERMRSSPVRTKRFGVGRLVRSLADSRTLTAKVTALEGCSIFDVVKFMRVVNEVRACATLVARMVQHYIRPYVADQQITGTRSLG